MISSKSKDKLTMIKSTKFFTKNERMLSGMRFFEENRYNLQIYVVCFGQKLDKSIFGQPKSVFFLFLFVWVNAD